MNLTFTDRDFIENYRCFCLRCNLFAAKALYAKITTTPDDAERKNLFLKIFMELMHATEMLQMVVFAVKNRDNKRGFLQNMLHRSNKADDNDAQCLYEEIKSYKGDEYGYIKHCLNYRISPEEYQKEKHVYDEIYIGIRAALQNRLAKSGQIWRVLVKAYNKLKHGWLVFDVQRINKAEKDQVAILLSKEFLKPVKINIEDAQEIIGIIEALENTISNLLDLMLIEHSI